MIHFLAFAAGELAIFFFFAGAAWCLGDAVLARFQFASRLERLALPAVAGLGSLGTLFFLLGSVHLFYAPAVITVLAGGWALGLSRLRAALRFHRGVGDVANRRRGVLLPLLGLLLLAPLVLAALYPAIDADTTMYHLPASLAFARSGGVPALGNLRYPVFPQMHELLGAAGILLGATQFTSLSNVLWCLLVVGLVAAWSARWGDARTGLLSSALWLGSPAVLSLARSGHVELTTSALATGALLAVEIWTEARARRWLYLAGALAGCAAATKYTGLYFLAVLPAVVLVKGRPGSRARDAAAFVIGSLVAAGPWYARIALLSGNPLWPFLGGVFGHRFWTPGDVQSAVWTLRQEGGPHTLAAFLKLPWTLSWSRQPGHLDPALFALFPLGVVFALLRPARRVLLVLAAGFLVFWFVTTQQTRFLLPIVPLIALLTAEAVVRLLDRLLRGRRAGWAPTAILATIFIVPGWAQLARFVARAGTPPADARTREAWLDRRLPSYACYRALNEVNGARYTVYAFHDEPMKFFCEGTQWGDWFGKGRYSDVDLSSGVRLFASLKRLDAGYLLVNDVWIPTRLPDDAFFRAHFVPVYRRQSVSAFRLR